MIVSMLTRHRGRAEVKADIHEANRRKTSLNRLWLKTIFAAES